MGTCCSGDSALPDYEKDQGEGGEDAGSVSAATVAAGTTGAEVPTEDDAVTDDGPKEAQGGGGTASVASEVTAAVDVGAGRVPADTSPPGSENLLGNAVRLDSSDVHAGTTSLDQGEDVAATDTATATQPVLKVSGSMSTILSLNSKLGAQKGPNQGVIHCDNASPSSMVLAHKQQPQPQQGTVPRSYSQPALGTMSGLHLSWQATKGKAGNNSLLTTADGGVVLQSDTAEWTPSAMFAGLADAKLQRKLNNISEQAV